VADHPLEALFRPAGIAVVGASRTPTKAGYQILKNLVDVGYPGALAPINPAGGEILGLPSRPDLSAVPGPLEMVVMAAPAAATPGVVGQMEARMAARGDIRAVVCSAAGFAEVGSEEGRRWQEQLAGFCRRHGIRLLGPNCVGVIDVEARIDTTFIADTSHLPGGISFVSQSGAVGAWLLMSWTAAPAGGVGFHRFLTVGNMADVDIIEGIEALGADPGTRVLGMYLEGSPRARRLVEAAGGVAVRKPVVALKVGRTAEGAQAAHSHTGSMAGTDALYEGAFRQFGLVRAASIGELSDTMRAFDSLPLPAGNRVFLYTQAGGPGIVGVDAMAATGLFQPAVIGPAAREALRRVLPPIASICKPEGHADITAAALAGHHVDGLEVVLRDPGVDAVVFITVATLFLDLEDMARRMLDLLARLRGEGIEKPLLPVILSGNWVRPARGVLEKGGLPTYDSPEAAVRVLAALTRYAAFRRRAGPGGGR
jgi:acyl-CoA synthetase (NDP forming)